MKPLLRAGSFDALCCERPFHSNFTLLEPQLSASYHCMLYCCSAVKHIKTMLSKPDQSLYRHRQRLAGLGKTNEGDSHLPQVATLTWHEGSRAAVRRSHARPDSSPRDDAYVMTWKAKSQEGRWKPTSGRKHKDVLKRWRGPSINLSTMGLAVDTTSTGVVVQHRAQVGWGGVGGITVRSLLTT